MLIYYSQFFLLSDSVFSQLCNHQSQRVRQPSPAASPPCAKSSRVHSHWDTLRRLTQHRLCSNRAFRIQRTSTAEIQNLDVKSCYEARRESYPPRAQPNYKSMSSCQACCSKPMSQCRVCYTNLLWEQSLNRSAPSIYSSVLIGKEIPGGPFLSCSFSSFTSPPSILHRHPCFSWINNVCFLVGDNMVEELNCGDEAGEAADTPSPLPTSRRWTMSPPLLTVPYYSNSDYNLQPGFHPRLRGQSPRIHTAPPSPMRPHRILEVPPVELAKQESLDELRTTVQLAASSMENSTKDIKLLGERMAAATERMAETVQDNSKALLLLTEVVDRLQTLLSTTRTEVSPQKSAELDEKTRGHRPSLTHQSRCSSASSTSLSTSQDTLSISQTTSCHSVSCRGSPRSTLKSKNAPSPPQRRHGRANVEASKHHLTNGLLDEPKEASGGRSNQRKKKRKKAT